MSREVLENYLSRAVTGCLHGSTTLEDDLRVIKRLGVKFMICGHMHRAYMLTPYDEKCTAKNNSYPVAVASACYEDDLWGGAFVIGKESLTVAFTDKNCVEREKYSVDYKTGNVERLF